MWNTRYNLGNLFNDREKGKLDNKTNTLLSQIFLNSSQFSQLAKELSMLVMKALKIYGCRYTEFQLFPRGNQLDLDPQP